MKFRVLIGRGKDALMDSVLEAATEIIENKGIVVDNLPRYEREHEKETNRLMKLAGQFVIDGEGGNDKVLLEFDTVEKTCVVVPIKDH